MRAVHIGLVAAAALAAAAGIVLIGEDAFEGIENGPVLTQLKRESRFGVTASDGRKLYDMVLERKATRALEVGTAQGYSALWIGAAMARTGGSLTTIEINAGRAADAAARFGEAGLSRLIDLRNNDALAELPKLDGPFDFVFLDPGVAINRRLFDLFKGKLAPGAVIVCHNGSTLYVRQQDYLDAVAATGEFTTRMIPTTSGGLHVAERTRRK